MTQELKKEIRALLLAHCPSVYFENAPRNARFPYLVFGLDCVYEEGRCAYTLEVNVWDRAEDSSVADDLADGISRGLDHCSSLTPAHHFRIYRETRNAVDDPDKTIRRRRLTFSVYAYERS